MYRLLSPLHCAASKSHLDAMEMLLKNGAKVCENEVKAGRKTF